MNIRLMLNCLPKFNGMAAWVAILVLAGCGGKPETKSTPSATPVRQVMPSLNPAPTAAPTTPTLPVTATTPKSNVPDVPAVTEGLSKQDMADLDNLSFLMRDYFNVNMAQPKDLNDLVKAGLIKELPTPPPGKTFMIDRKNNRVVVVNK